MPPKVNAPKPVEFHVCRMQAGKKTWIEGGSGGFVTPSLGFLGGGPAKSIPKKEVLVVGKVLFGRQRLAFEVQEIDNSPAAIRKLLKKEKELRDARFGSCDPFGFGGFDSEREESPDRSKRGSTDIFDLCRAKELAPKHSLQVKFQDIDHIEENEGIVTLVMSQPLQCYIKPAGEPKTVNMEVGKDITGGAKRISFTIGAGPESPGLLRRSESSKLVSFSEARQMLSDYSPRLQALFRGEVPPRAVATPARKRSNQEGGGSATKKPRAEDGALLADIIAGSGSWLQKVVERFQLKGMLDPSVSDMQWKAYFHERTLLELREQASLEESAEDDSVWPESLGPKPNIAPLAFESYQDEGGEQEMASNVLEQIRSSIRATIKSSSLKLDPEVFAKGVYLLAYHINDADEGEPRTVEANARIYAPNGSGNFVDLKYHNHKRVRMSFTERFSHLSARPGGQSSVPGPMVLKQDGYEKIFDLDFNECRRKNPTKTSLASNAVLCRIGLHLFGAEGAMSNRKVFGLLVRSVGLGKFGENNGWPVAVARRRFKCGKDETETDTESIPGDRDEEASVGDCCVM